MIHPSTRSARTGRSSPLTGTGAWRGSRQHRRRSRLGVALVVLLIWGLWAWTEPTAKRLMAQDSIRLTDVTDSSGIDFRHDDGSTGDHLIVEYVSAGIATFDYDNDGDIDLYFLSGRPPRSSGRRATNRLYRNDGNWRFADITKRSGVGDTGHALGAVVGDYDNDGDADLYVVNSGQNRLFRNDGDGRFSDVTQRAGVGNGNRVGAGACFLDIDADGDVDLYVANYLKLDDDRAVRRTLKGYRVYASPLDYHPESDTLYRNNGDGTFSDVSDQTGIASHVGYGMGMIAFDFDRDRDTDILVGNDVGANFLFENDGRGHFTEIGLLSGLAYDGKGSIQGTMGVDCGDYDNDGFLDIHATSYQNELSTLYRNLDGQLFEDVTAGSKVGQGTFAQVTWGNGLIDFDNDGDRDLFIACGHLHDNVDQFDDRTSYEATNLLYTNLGNGTFRNVTDTSGSGMQVKRSSRGAAFDDLDNDGDVDIIVLNSRREPTLLRNDSPTQNKWLKIKLVGSTSNREGVGSRVVVTSQGRQQTAEVHRGRGYQSHFGSRLHFGLGDAPRVQRVDVYWLGGAVQTLTNVATNQVLTVRQAERVEPAR